MYCISLYLPKYSIHTGIFYIIIMRSSWNIRKRVYNSKRQTLSYRIRWIAEQSFPKTHNHCSVCVSGNNIISGVKKFKRSGTSYCSSECLLYWWKLFTLPILFVFYINSTKTNRILIKTYLKITSATLYQNTIIKKKNFLLEFTLAIIIKIKKIQKLN